MHERLVGRLASTVGIVTALAALVVGAVPATPIARAVGQPLALDPGATFRELGFGDETVRGITPTVDRFIALEPGETVSGPWTLTLDVAHSPMLLGDRSSMTVVAGDVALTSVPLGPDTAAGLQVSTAVPPELIGADGLFVQLRFYLRVTDDDCEDPANPALWATVEGTSRIDAAVVQQGRDLADLDRIVVDAPVAKAPRSLAVADPSDGDVLAAAGAVAFWLGRADQVRQRDAVLDLTTPTADLGDGAVVVGDAAALAAVGVDVGRDGPTLAVSQGDRGWLGVSGPTGRAVRRAARALADRRWAAELRGPSVVLGTRTPPPAPARSLPWTDGAASFAQLGLGERTVTGPGTHVLEIAADRPPGWELEQDATLRLVVDASPAVQSTSWVRAQVAGVDLGTRRLRPGAGPVPLRFTVPAGRLDRRLDGTTVRSLPLQLTFELTPRHRACEPFDGAAVRATVLDASAWSLPHGDADSRDLGRFPADLADGARGGDAPSLAIVLPDAPDPATVAAGLQMSAAVGRWAAPGARAPLVTTVSDLPDDVRDDANLILLGDADRRLGERIDVATAPTARPPGAVSAALRLAPSPFDGDRTVLLVRGGPDAQLLAARSLATSAVFRDLTGTEAVLVGSAPQLVERGDDPTLPASITPVLADDDDEGRIVVAVVVLVALLALVLTFVWFRWLRPRRH